MAGRDSNQVQASTNSFRILERLVAADQPMGVTELAEAVGLSKGVVHNHLSTFAELGYVKRRDQQYLPSFSLLKLGANTRDRLPGFEAITRQIKNLALVTNEVATVFVEEDGVGICLHITLGSNSWTPEYVCGSRIPLHANAPGKAILASLDPQRVDEIIDEQGLPTMTEETITDRERLDAELRTVKEVGVAFCRGEQFSDIVGVATPIALGDRTPAAAIGVCGPTERLSGRYLEEDITGQVISAAKSLEVDVGN